MMTRRLILRCAVCESVLIADENKAGSTCPVCSSEGMEERAIIEGAVEIVFKQSVTV